MKNYSLGILLLFCFGALLVQGQKNPKKVIDSTKNFRLTALPVVFYLPETGLGYGALGIGTFRFKGEQKESRPSTVQLAITLTSKRQILLFAPFELYSDEEKWRFIGELGYYKYFYNFFGKGINTSEEDLETYEVNFPRVRFSVLREVLPDISMGLAYEFDKFSQPIVKEGGILDTNEFVGDEGGVISNLGLTALYDTRDNIFFPTKGFFIQANVFSSLKALGSSFSYNKWILDSRFYQQIKGRHVLATNVFLANSSENTPFLDLNYLGSKRSRGFDNRRFQDNSELSLALEYRFPIYRRIEGVVFGSTGTVAPDLGSVFSSAFKNGAGAGLRYVINRKEGTRIRIDYGQTNEGGNFYFTINEAF
ncbi:MAG: BamA/TamA family outer membrane protein [Maribacter sp.]